MGILDQLFSDDPARTKVSLQRVTIEDWNIPVTTMAVHQAMAHGFAQDPEGFRGIDKPQFGKAAIEVGDAITISNNYRKILTQEITADSRFKATADDVLDSGIKNGSKVIIKIVPESEGNIGSWGDIVRTTITDQDGTPTDLTFDKFSVISLSETDEQRYNLHQTFGADIIQTFGTRPRFLTLSGQVLNGKLDVSIRGQIRSMDWKNAFQRFYEKHYSAHACTKRGKKVRIFAQDTIYEGYMLSMATVTSATEQGISQISIQMVMKSRDFPRNNDEKIPGFVYSSGFAVTGGSVPDDYFPQPSLELYFHREYENAVLDSLREIQERAVALRKEIAQLAFGGEEEPITDWMVAFRTDLEAANKDRYKIADEYAPLQKSPDFIIHSVYRGSNLEKDIDVALTMNESSPNFLELRRSLKSTIAKANRLAHRLEALVIEVTNIQSLKKVHNNAIEVPSTGVDTSGIA